MGDKRRVLLGSQVWMKNFVEFLWQTKYMAHILYWCAFPESCKYLICNFITIRLFMFDGRSFKMEDSMITSLPPSFPGWDQGLLGMCLGEKRKLQIPAKLGYGEQGSPPTIPGNLLMLMMILLILNSQNLVLVSKINIWQLDSDQIGLFYWTRLYSGRRWSDLGWDNFLRW